MERIAKCYQSIDKNEKEKNRREGKALSRKSCKQSDFYEDFKNYGERNFLVYGMESVRQKYRAHVDACNAKVGETLDGLGIEMEQPNQKATKGIYTVDFLNNYAWRDYQKELETGKEKQLNSIFSVHNIDRFLKAFKEGRGNTDSRIQEHEELICEELKQWTEKSIRHRNLTEQNATEVKEYQNGLLQHPLYSPVKLFSQFLISPKRLQQIERARNQEGEAGLLEDKIEVKKNESGEEIQGVGQQKTEEDREGAKNEARKIAIGSVMFKTATRRTCKYGIEWQNMHEERDKGGHRKRVLAFLLDPYEQKYGYGSVTQKTAKRQNKDREPITSSELRKVYREEIKWSSDTQTAKEAESGRVIFYNNFKRVLAPWQIEAKKVQQLLTKIRQAKAGGDVEGERLAREELVKVQNFTTYAKKRQSKNLIE